MKHARRRDSRSLHAETARPPLQGRPDGNAQASLIRTVRGFRHGHSRGMLVRPTKRATRRRIKGRRMSPSEIPPVEAIDPLDALRLLGELTCHSSLRCVHCYVPEAHTVSGRPRAHPGSPSKRGTPSFAACRRIGVESSPPPVVTPRRVTSPPRRASTKATGGAPVRNAVAVTFILR